MARYADNDPRSLLGDDDGPADRYADKRPSRTARPTAAAGTTRQTRRTARRSDEDVVRQVRDGKPAKAAPSGLYDRLADQFLAQDWIAHHRGNTTMAPPIEVGDTGRPLIASILRKKVTSEKRLEGRDEEKIAEVVEYAMKHFFDRLGNDERHGRLVNRFVSSDWWDTLLTEAIDHWHTVRLDPKAFERGKAEAEAFYAAWPKRERRPSRLLDLTSPDQPNYDDCEELL